MESMFFTGALLKFRKKRKMDEPDWFLELVIVPIYIATGNYIVV
jgi:hypothetical protein